MKVVIQRVSRATILIDGITERSIKEGLVVLLGITNDDDIDDIDWLLHKIMHLRIFGDDEGKMNLDIQHKKGQLLIVSQFTLYASTKKGNRPSFIQAAKPEIAIPLYEQFIQKSESYGLNVITGEFGADMKINLINDGPVTIIIDSKSKV